MNHYECMNSFLHLEENAKNIVQKFKYNDELIWQYLRMAFFYRYYRGARAKDIGLRTDTLFNSDVFSFDISASGRQLLSRYATGHRALVFTRGWAYTQILDGMAYDPYMDQIYVECDNLGLNPVKLKIDGKHICNPFVPVLDLPLLKTGRKIINACEVAENKYYQEYVRISCENRIPYIFALGIIKYFFEVENYRILFENVLSAIKPEVVFLPCYYVPIAMGLSHACRNFGIPCVECQHGLQDWPHLPYNFPAMPVSGWETVPEWFFMWGDKSARSTGKWFAGQSFHKTIVAGNPAYVAWKNGTLRGDSVLLNAFDKRIAGRIPVCVALPVSYPEDKTVLLREMIVKSPKEWLWLLRRHPSYKINEPCDEIEAVKDLSDRVEYDMATKMNLHDLLSRSKHLVTTKSSTVYEAVSLHGLRCTTLSEEGKRGFSLEIKEKNIEFASDAEDALKSISAGIENYPLKAADPYVNPDIHALGRAIQSIVRHSVASGLKSRKKNLYFSKNSRRYVKKI